MSIPQVIAIDGPASSGKSTLGERLARTLGYLYLDTGVSTIWILGPDRATVELVADALSVR